MTEEEKEAIENIKRILENANPFTMPLHIHNSLTTVLNLIQNLQEENNKKDKVIDLMAEHIVSSAIVDDTVCAIKCDCDIEIEEDCSHKKMLKCTKQYFKQKATDIWNN